MWHSLLFLESSPFQFPWFSSNWGLLIISSCTQTLSLYLCGGSEIILKDHRLLSYVLLIMYRWYLSRWDSDLFYLFLNMESMKTNRRKWKLYFFNAYGFQEVILFEVFLIVEVMVVRELFQIVTCNYWKLMIYHS